VLSLYTRFFLQIAPSVKEWMVEFLSFLAEDHRLVFAGGMVLGFGSFVASLRILKYSG
jgi:hypothetical protein